MTSATCMQRLSRKQTWGRVLGRSRDMGGSVEMGAAALRQAVLCWWRRYCSTMELSLEETGASDMPPRAPAACAPFLSGGLAMACLRVDLQRLGVVGLLHPAAG